MTNNAMLIRTLDDFLYLLPGYKTLGNGKYSARCPAHDDKNPSLSITFNNGKILLHDHGGCTTENVVKAMGLTMADLSLNGYKLDTDQRNEVAVYKYTDASGKPFEVVRYEPKGFSQRRPNGNSGYIYNLEGIERTLYHQDELLAAIEKGTSIYIVEGEKDVDRLRSLGLTATCNSGGANNKWLPQYTAALKGADLVILPDNDKPGREHAQKVAQACHSTASRVRILELPSLPDKGDVSDWIDNGGNAGQLEELAEACPDWTPTVNDNGITLRRMKNVKAEYVSWLWEPYIAIGKLTLLEGDPGIGKSWITLAIATAISLGKALPGQTTSEQGTVILASAEDGLGDTIRPRLDAMKADVEHIHAIDGAISFDDAGFVLIESYIVQVKPKILIIDPLVAYLGAGMDFHRANETRPVMARLAKLAEKYALAILAVRHLAKGGQNKAIYRGIGSIDFTAACRSVLLAGSDSEDANNLAIVHIKSNLAAKGPSQGYQLKDEGFYWTGESSLTSAQILADDSNGIVSELDEAIAFLKEELADGPVPAKDVIRDAEGTGISKRTLNRAKSQIGVVTGRRGEKGKQGGGVWTWELPPADLHYHNGNLNKGGVENINIATEFSGNLNNSVANNLIKPNNLATLITEEIVLGDGRLVDEPSLELNDDVAAIIGMTLSEALDIYTANGKPLIHLSDGVNCGNLEIFLSSLNERKPEQIEAVKKWLMARRLPKK